MLPENCKILFSAEEVQAKVKEVAAAINDYYGDEPVVAICVLKGGFMFFSDLVKHLKNDPEVDFVRLASYHDGTCPEAEIQFTKDLEIPIRGKHVLVVEDIVDTGNSMDFLFKQLEPRGVKSVRLCSMIDKHERRRADMTVDFPGFTVEKGFVFGYGMDYAEKYRELAAIYELEI